MKIIKFIIIVGLSYSVSHACIVTVTNDTDKPVKLVAEKDNSRSVLIAPKKQAEFGDEHQHINFYLMEQQNGGFKKKFLVQQTACVKSNPDAAKFTVTKITNEQLDNRFFKTVPYKGSRFDTLKNDMNI